MNSERDLKTEIATLKADLSRLSQIVVALEKRIKQIEEKRVGPPLIVGDSQLQPIVPRVPRPEETPPAPPDGPVM